MPDYRRNRVPGGSFFLTVNRTTEAQTCWAPGSMRCGRLSGQVRARAPSHIGARVILPDHMHCLWSLPKGDANFPGRGPAIKIVFSKSLPDVCYRPRHSRIHLGNVG